jgi:hypothetical protein
MKVSTVIAALAIVAMNQTALASDKVQQAPIAKTVSQEDVATALAVLIEAGIIRVSAQGEIIVKDKTALGQLREEGRVMVQEAAEHSICF